MGMNPLYQNINKFSYKNGNIDDLEVLEAKLARSLVELLVL